MTAPDPAGGVPDGARTPSGWTCSSPTTSGPCSTSSWACSAATRACAPCAGSRAAREALRELSSRTVDAAFLDIHMPGLTGLDLARALSRFADRPAVVFVTADEARALEAFDVEAVDYVLKPVRRERLARAVDRVVERVAERTAAGRAPRPTRQRPPAPLPRPRPVARREAPHRPTRRSS